MPGIPFKLPAILPGQPELLRETVALKKLICPLMGFFLCFTSCESDTVFSKSNFYASSSTQGTSSSTLASPSPSPTVSAAPPASPGPSPTVSSTPSSGGNPSSAASYFPSNIYFNQPIINAPVDSQSPTVISTLQANGWGNGNRFQIDFSLDVYYTDSSTVNLPFQDNGMTAPDSDELVTMPVPPNGGVQGFEGQMRNSSGVNGDAHYMVMDLIHNQLDEVFSADDVTNSVFGSDGSLAIWPFNKNWASNFRGDTCTSADAGGLMIAPMLFTAEEINAGAITHAIRLILPNPDIAFQTYVRPSTHMTGASGWGDPNTGVPYGARLRLKSSFNIAGLPSIGARVIATALQTYGMILADGGQIALTAKSDTQSTAKYGDLLGSHDLFGIQPSDFDMIDAGTRLRPADFTCVRNP